VAVTPNTLRLGLGVRRDLLKIADKHTRDLTAAWARAWDEVAGDLELAIIELINGADGGRISQAAVMRSTRLRYSLDSIARELNRLADEAGILVTGDLLQIVRDAADAQEAIVSSQLPKNQQDALASWSRVDSRQIVQIVQRTTEHITSQMWPISAEAQGVIRRELVRGIAAGTSPRATAARMLKRAEGGFNGGLTRALTIARTETLDAHRRASQAAHDLNKDVLRGWMWLAAMSSRTCPACLGMNGTEHPLTEDGPLGHQNCRCTRVPLSKSWKDLGIDLDEPAPVKTSSKEWFDSQDEKAQRKILGPTKLAAYKRGDYPMDQWAVRRENKDWRPSYVPSPVPRPGRSERLAS
jgi:SPP1 gp7 family putative phage head morphogenesis protein